MPPVRRGAVAALAVAVAVLLLAGTLAAVVVGREDDEGGAAGGGRGLEAVVPRLQRFVEQARGLPFKVPVRVTLLDDAAFRQRLAEVNARTDDAAADVETADRVLTALGLLDDGVDLAGTVDSLLAEGVAGFYDPRTDELVVRGEEATPSVRATLVHELTHALQDQHFELDRRDLEARDDESLDAFTALVEGDAVRIEARYVRSLPRAEARSVEADERRAAARIGPGVPRAVLELLGFPYVAGPGFVAALLARGGQPALDAAFAAPPVTSEQVLHPEAFLRGEGPSPVEPPPADGPVVDAGVVGELGLLLVLAEELPAAEAAAAARGWGGDRYVAWRRGDQTCVRASVAMDTPADAARLDAALARWAARHPSATVDRSAGVRFTACG